MNNYAGISFVKMSNGTLQVLDYNVMSEVNSNHNFNRLI